ncbi:UNVERIFIED_ORG: membrane protein implicated in regulation of membrane protease activity [Comamonas terrigena]
MYLIVIAWFYVTLMMALAEAASPQGSILGAVITFVLYGLLPMSILVYILGTPARKRRLKAQREAEQRDWDAAHAATAPSASLPDAGGHAPGAAEDACIAAVRKEP